MKQSHLSLPEGTENRTVTVIVLSYSTRTSDQTYHTSCAALSRCGVDYDLFVAVEGYLVLHFY